jgi:hypothetical protein
MRLFDLLFETYKIDLDPTTAVMTIDFDPLTITYEEFQTLRRIFIANRDHADEFLINGTPYRTIEAAGAAIVALLQGRIDAAKARKERWQSAWMTAHPELKGVTELVPTRWLAGLKGNALRHDVADLAADMRAHGCTWPVIIIVGKKDRYARIGEGNHRIAAALTIDMDMLPARCIVQNNAKVGTQMAYNVDHDLLIPADGYVSSDLKPSKVFRSLSKLASTP